MRRLRRRPTRWLVLFLLHGPLAGACDDEDARNATGDTDDRDVANDAAVDPLADPDASADLADNSATDTDLDSPLADDDGTVFEGPPARPGNDPACPPIGPAIGTPCTGPDFSEMCTYGESECCGIVGGSYHTSCYEGEWVPIIVDTPCAMGEPCPDLDAGETDAGEAG